MIKELKIQENLFVKEELDRIEELIRLGEISKLMNVLNEITPAKEIEIQRIINQMSDYVDGFDSDVRERMKRECPNGPQNPEEEAFWEKELQNEFKSHVKSVDDRKNGIVKALDSKPKEIKSNRTLEEVRDELTFKLKEFQKKSKIPNIKESKLEEMKAQIAALQEEEETLINLADKALIDGDQGEIKE